MFKEILIQLYRRDLNKLKSEVDQYRDETDLWKTGPGITNSAGNLTLHLTGNLKHFVGGTLGGTGYKRDRDLEFADTGVPKERLLADIDETAAVIQSVLEDLTEEELAKVYPIDVFGQPMTSAYFLVHLTTHFNYHLGQINYHRRLLSAD